MENFVEGTGVSILLRRKRLNKHAVLNAYLTEIKKFLSNTFFTQPITLTVASQSVVGTTLSERSDIFIVIWEKFIVRQQQ